MSKVHILGSDGRPIRVEPATKVRARYDAAQTTDENRRHWSSADGMSSREANSPDVRMKLRNRARYEVANNTYAKGMILTLANDVIGTGPRLQLASGDSSEDRRVEAEFERWTEAVGLAAKLNTMRQSRAVDGEAFARLANNDAIDHPVTLDLLLIEADRVTTPTLALLDPLAVDGIRIDPSGNPIAYDVLRDHPGDAMRYSTEFDRFPARVIVHWFRADRPGQYRGVPEITPALPLFAQLRRYTLAVVAAAETAADFAAILYSDMPPDGETADAEPFESLEIERRMMTTVPAGWKMAQFKAEQPTTTYADFKHELLNEIARCLNMPYNVAAGNSSGYNYASGRLDHQVYFREIGIDQYHAETVILKRVLAAWLGMARNAGIISGDQYDTYLSSHLWFWDGQEHVDPSKEAAAQETRLRNNTTTLAMEYARRGLDWEAAIRQRAREVALMKSLGLPTDGGPSGLSPSPDDANENDEDESPMNATMRIRASGSTINSRVSIAAVPTFDFEARGSNGTAKRPAFTMHAYTGSAMVLNGFYTPVILDLKGLKAGRDKVPILFNHDHARVIGQATTTIDASGVHVDGTITGDDDDSSRVTSHARNGFEWQASIGATIVRQEFLKAGEKAVVNGREVAGPLLIAREARLYEVSFVASGADPQTTVSVAASMSPVPSTDEDHMKIDEWVRAKGFDPAALNDEQSASLRAAFDAERAANATKSSESTATATAATTTAVATQQQAQATRTLDAIMADAKAERDRVAKITDIADKAIRDRPMHMEDIEAMAKTAIEAKSSPIDFELSVLRLTANTQGPAVIVRKGASDMTASAVEAAICLTAKLPNVEKEFDDRTMEAANRHFRHGLGLRDVLLMAARANGYAGHGTSDIREILGHAFGERRNVQASGFSTIAIDGILSNVANKFLLAGFTAVESTWRSIARVASVRDFKATTSYVLTGGMTYEKVGPGGELTHATADELEYTNRAETYGRMFAITRKDIINDDLGALTAIPQRLGRGAALKLNSVFWTEFMNNSSFFTSGNGSYFEGGTTNLSINSLTTAEQMFFDQTDPDGDPLGITPKILLVPNALNAVASQLMNSLEIRDTTASTKYGVSNPHAGKFTVQRSAYLSNAGITGYSTKAWYLLADPMELATVEVAFLNGREMPIVESADADFNTLGIQMRGYHDFGVAKQEYRAGVKSKGEA